MGRRGRADHLGEAETKEFDPQVAILGSSCIPDSGHGREPEPESLAESLAHQLRVQSVGQRPRHDRRTQSAASSAFSILLDPGDGRREAIDRTCRSIWRPTLHGRDHASIMRRRSPPAPDASKDRWGPAPSWSSPTFSDHWIARPPLLRPGLPRTDDPDRPRIRRASRAFEARSISRAEASRCAALRTFPTSRSTWKT